MLGLYKEPPQNHRNVQLSEWVGLVLKRLFTSLNKAVYTFSKGLTRIATAPAGNGNSLTDLA
eukprot:6242163-Amphidinium_carterae.1